MVYTISTAFAIYFVIWWIVLFLTLPFGVRSQHEDGGGANQMIPGTDPGAPIVTGMGRKLIWTTIISAIIFAVAWLAYNAGLLNIERLSKLMGIPL
jgi:predicted secreted protein